MRPVFNDMVTELQRSLSFFQNLDRKAHINNVVVLGNTIKLPGLKQYLTKHLGYNVIDFENFERLAGDGVTKSPAFRDNLLAFGPCYGLCLQGLKNSKLSTNLLPREITTERMIRAKKPWAVAAVALFLMGCAFNYISHNIGWRKAHLADWQPSLTRVTSVSQVSAKFKDDDDKKKKRLEFITKLGDEVVGNPDRRILWLELTKAVSAALPRTIDDPKRRNEILDPKIYPFSKQKELRITSVESQYFPDLKLWYDGQGGAVKKRFADLISQPDMIAAQAAPQGQVPPAGQASVPGQVAPGQAGPTAPMAPGAAPPAASSEATNTATAGALPEGPQGPGWVIEIHGITFILQTPSTLGLTMFVKHC